MSQGCTRDSEVTCEIQHLKLPGLHPAPPPARLQVQLLPPLPRHLLPHLHQQRAAEAELLLSPGLPLVAARGVPAG